MDLYNIYFSITVYRTANLRLIQNGCLKLMLRLIYGKPASRWRERQQSPKGDTDGYSTLQFVTRFESIRISLSATLHYKRQPHNEKH